MNKIFIVKAKRRWGKSVNTCDENFGRKMMGILFTHLYYNVNESLKFEISFNENLFFSNLPM